MSSLSLISQTSTPPLSPQQPAEEFKTNRGALIKDVRQEYYYAGHTAYTVPLIPAESPFPDPSSNTVDAAPVVQQNESSIADASLMTS